MLSSCTTRRIPHPIARAVCNYSSLRKRPLHYQNWSKPVKYRSFVDEVVRVDHAGELGALSIYQGQLDVLNKLPAWWAPGLTESDPNIHNGDTPVAAIEHMLAQEQEHLDKFNSYMREYQCRPSLMAPIWHAAGYLAGGASALMGEKTAMALTIAIEEVIQEHYNDQIRTIHELGIKDEEPELRTTLVKFRDDEAEHCQTGIDYHGLEAPFYQQLSTLVKGGCQVAIKLAEKI